MPHNHKNHSPSPMPNQLEMYEITLDKLWELYDGPENELKSVLLKNFTKKLSEYQSVKAAIDEEQMMFEEQEEPEDRVEVERKIARERLQAQNPEPKIMVHPEPQSGKRPPTDEVSPLVMAPEYIHRKRVNDCALRQILIDTEMENRKEAKKMIFPYRRIDLALLY